MKALDEAAEKNNWSQAEKERVRRAVNAAPKTDHAELGVDDVERIAHAIGVFVRWSRRFFGAIKSVWPF